MPAQCRDAKKVINGRIDRNPPARRVTDICEETYEKTVLCIPTTRMVLPFQPHDGKSGFIAPKRCDKRAPRARTRACATPPPPCTKRRSPRGEPQARVLLLH